MKYRVRIEGQDREIEVYGSAVQVDGEPATVTPGALDGELEVTFRGRVLRLRPLPERADGSVAVLLDGRVIDGHVSSEKDRLRERVAPTARRQGPGTLRSEIPGVIRHVMKSVGDAVNAGDPLLTLEAMKMENEVRAESDGIVLEILVEVGQIVGAGEVLAVLGPSED